MKPCREILLFSIAILIAQTVFALDQDVQLCLAGTDNLTGSICEITLNWKSTGGMSQLPESVLFRFTDMASGDTWYDRHQVPKIQTTQSANGPWNPAYTVPVWLPDRTGTVDWSISVVTPETEYPDRLVIHAAATSVHRRMEPVVTDLPPPLETFSPTMTGWYDVEHDTTHNDSWRWTGETARIVARNPGLPCRLDVSALNPRHPDASGELRINDHVIPLPAIRPGEYECHMDIPAEWLGTSETIAIEISTSHSFIPASVGEGSDTRELGLMVRSFRLCILSSPPECHPVIDLIDPAQIIESWQPVYGHFSVKFPNPGRAVDLFLKGWIPPGIMTPVDRLTARLGEDVIHVIDHPGENPAIRLTLPQEVMGGHPEIVLNIDLDPGVSVNTAPPAMILTRVGIE